jgi:hypothetical protein
VIALRDTVLLCLLREPVRPAHDAILPFNHFLATPEIRRLGCTRKEHRARARSTHLSFQVFCASVLGIPVPEELGHLAGLSRQTASPALKSR